MVFKLLIIYIAIMCSTLPPLLARRRCRRKTDICEPNPCQNGGQCIKGIQNYTCTCQPGFTGDNCGENINECNPNPCQNNGQCTDGINNYTCTCVLGYHGYNCETAVFECYEFTAQDWAEMGYPAPLAKQKEQCEKHDHNIFTQGYNSNYPGTGGCWCIQPKTE